MSATVRITTPIDGDLRAWDCSSCYEPPTPVFEKNIDWRQLLPTTGGSSPAGEVVIFTGAQESLEEQPEPPKPTWTVVEKLGAGKTWRIINASLLF